MKPANMIKMDEILNADALTITETGTTQETGWPAKILTTFTIDFRGATLQQVIAQAIQHMIVGARPALKKTGYDILKANPVCTIEVAKIGTRAGGITAAGMIASLAAKAANGTLTHEDTKNISKEARRALIAVLSAQ